MKKLLTATLLCFSLSAAAQLNVHVPTIDEVGATRLPANIAPVHAPFSVPAFKKPIFPKYTITIKGQGSAQTKEIQQAIDAVSKKGGGTVIIPAGNWHSGRIALKSNVNLHLEENAVLEFGGEIRDYLPVVFTRTEGVEVMSLGACIYANGQHNIAVTGKGKLVGPPANCPVRKQVMRQDVIENVVAANKPVSQRIYDGHDGGPVYLPMFVSAVNCKNVYLEGLQLENTPFWNIVPIYCDNVIIRGITVNSVGIPSGDGIDIESSKNVLIEYCTLNCGDDCFTLKAGRGEDGLRIGKPTENVVIRYSLARQGHGGITVGSETAAMIRNLYVHDVVFDDTEVGLRFKTRRPRGGGGENLHYERIRMRLRLDAFRWDMLGARMYVGALADRLPALPVNKLTPVYRNIYAKDIVVDSARALVRVDGIPESPMTGFHLQNVEAHCTKFLQSIDANVISISNANIYTTDSAVTLTDSRNITFDKVHVINPANKVVVNISGELTDNIRFSNSVPEKPEGWETATWKKN
ncbi:glycoside hydrolase family 28 protein [Chitinophaga pinensis]|uniref:Glycoside hydrolase family 28 n=1 Tax=Chitinophaga pinensis (strain ATCC 43595 / DSM 2588 / LMG 13176 / NBRC 15968 / NCIMB 11800 / UQM 2034) TaxID=485918 RepID=A0A979GYQ3_CHIPD|nr:glycoside hydrolase family 28 protein [Chitinophaga pinensis]ACU63321.1 glycoside hydrolase family 28 [Chitinophaga pinensis DSM 2588]